MSRDNFAPTVPYQFHACSGSWACGDEDCENCNPGCITRAKTEAAIERLVESHGFTKEGASTVLEDTRFDLTDFLDDPDYFKWWERHRT